MERDSRLQALFYGDICRLSNTCRKGISNFDGRVRSWRLARPTLVGSTAIETRIAAVTPDQKRRSP